MLLPHEPWLVVLSFVVAFQGSYVGLHLARKIRVARGTAQRALITGSALTLALGIWTMHFVGMLAVKLPVTVDFLVLPTLLSFLVCVLVVGFAVFAVGSKPPSRMRTALAALFMGAGIVTMHYLGMLALHAGAGIAHDPIWVAASILIGIGVSGFALWSGFEEGTARSLSRSAVLMGLAISAMHYTAMAGLSLHVHAGAAAPEMPALSPGLLALVVSVVTFVVSGLFLLTLVPEPARTGGDLAGEPPKEEVSAPVLVLSPRPAATDRPAAEPARAAHGPPADSLPVERDGRRLQLAVSHVVAVQAQAHYTNLFDGETIWFCSLPISEVEALLDPAVFARIHRSHIVNLDHVAAIRKAAESDIVAMAARIPYQAPVSRSRRSWLKQRLGERMRPV